MNHWLMTCLLAETPRADQFVKGFREGTLHRTASYDWLLIAVASFAIVLAYYVFDRFLRRRGSGSLPNERRLFHDLCRAHGLDRASIGLLQRIAKRAQLAQVSAVFLKPELFQPQGATARRDQNLIDRLRGQLFAN